MGVHDGRNPPGRCGSRRDLGRRKPCRSGVRSNCATPQTDGPENDSMLVFLDTAAEKIKFDERRPRRECDLGVSDRCKRHRCG